MDDFGINIGIERAIVRKANLTKIPASAVFQIIPTCNMKCSMCYLRMSHSRMNKLGGFLPLETWKEIALQLKKMGTLFILITGGEPLLYPYFKELYLFLAKEGFILTLNTNGTLLNQEIINLFSTHKPRRVNVTLYGASSETYKELCQYPEGYERCLNGLQLLKEHGIDTRVSITVTKENYREYEEMAAIAKKLGFPILSDCYMVAQCNKLCEERDIVSHRLTPQDAARLAIKQWKFSYRKNFSDFAKSYTKIVQNGEMSQKGNLCMTCRAGISSCWIDFRGFMQPCDMLWDKGVSLKEHTVAEAWELAKQISRNEYAHEECNGCNFKPICNVCYANAIAEKKMCGNLDYLCEIAKYKFEFLKEECK